METALALSLRCARPSPAAGVRGTLGSHSAAPTSRSSLNPCLQWHHVAKTHPHAILQPRPIALPSLPPRISPSAQDLWLSSLFVTSTGQGAN
ncbi:hypothetical protein AAFF_G00421420 [Aldrovandia affinis]|uniref:Uncharacterized protein n=1 Tax=Aldrovandia affinis TaxID=143900 RepID=A0AAD7S9S7_9TELE|nr:hypothetical protein AAFF_G00421420 [Aldrovandia affinis]